MTLLLQLTALLILAAVSLYALWKRAWGYPDGSIPGVLAYHKIVRFESGGTWTSPKRFEKQISSLLESGRTFIDETAFVEVLDGARSSIHGEILLTFDDGYDCFASHAAHILEGMGVPALIFLVTGYVGRKNEWELGLPGRTARHMDWETVCSLGERGFSFGSHCISHAPLTRLGREEALEEMVRSKEEIEERTGRRVLSLSYPFGRAGESVAALAEQAGYKAAFTLYPAGPAGKADRYRLRREGVWVIDTPRTINVKLSRGGFFWVEDVKGRLINAFADLTPVLKRS